MIDESSVGVDSPIEYGFAITSWGEEARIRIPASQTDGRLAVMDYRAPAGFGPPRHVHRADDEILLVEQGTLAVWTTEKCNLAKPGDIVMLPKGIPHTWRAYGESPVHLQVIVAPGEFQTFFSGISEQDLLISDIEELTAVAYTAGMDILGPPLSDQEVAVIRAGGRVE